MTRHVIFAMRTHSAVLTVVVVAAAVVMVAVISLLLRHAPGDPRQQQDADDQDDPDRRGPVRVVLLDGLLVDQQDGRGRRTVRTAAVRQQIGLGAVSYTH